MPTSASYEQNIVNRLRMMDPQLATGLGTPVRKIIEAVALEMGGYDADAEETYRGIAFYFEHKVYPTGEKTIMEQSMSIDALEEKLGYDFFVNLPDMIGEEGAAAVESVVDDRW